MKSLAVKWRDFKARVKAKYYYPYKTDEERLKHRDRRVLPHQWPILISYWNTKKAKVYARCWPNFFIIILILV
jgi:hypothetical protein